MFIGVKRDVAKIVWTEYDFFEFIFTKYVYFYIFTSK